MEKYLLFSFIKNNRFNLKLSCKCIWYCLRLISQVFVLQRLERRQPSNNVCPLFSMKTFTHRYLQSFIFDQYKNKSMELAILTEEECPFLSVCHSHFSLTTSNVFSILIYLFLIPCIDVSDFYFYV